MRSIRPSGGADLAISGRSATYEGVVGFSLCPTGVVACASPDYLSGRAPLSHPNELAGHDCLVFRPAGSNWQFQGTRGLIHIEVTPGMVADDNITLVRAAIGGLGIVLLPRYICGQDLAADQLVPLLSDFPPPATWFRIFIPRRKRQVVRIRALVDLLTDRVSDENWLARM